MKKKMMKRRKTRLIIACVAVILAVSVAGTMAYLTDTTGPVNNTFTIGKLLDDPLSFVLKEHKVTDDDHDGLYTLGTEEVDGNDYTVLPGVNLPKDPFVKTTETLKLDAYVFIEAVKSDDFGTALSYTVDTTCWTPLTGKSGLHGGEVYVMAANGGVIEAGSKLGPITILKDKQITVDNATFVSDGDAIKKFGGKVSFYGYMIQAGGFTDYNDAWAGYIGG